MPSITVRAEYLAKAFGNLDNIVSEIRQQVNVRFDTVVGTGLSGALVVPYVGRALQVYWMIVRKDDGAHSFNRVEGELGKRWLFVDDQIESGRTRAHARDAIATIASQKRWKTEYVGTYLYLYGGRFIRPDSDNYPV